MRPAVLANLIGSVDVKVLSRAQLLDQLAAKLGLAGLLVAFGLDLAQPLRSTADHELTQPHTLTATP